MIKINISINIGQPNEKQKLFFESRVKNTSFGGARGGGKSWAVRMKAFLLSCIFEGIKIIIMRRTYAELTNNHITPLREFIPQKIAKYNDTRKEFLFVNGSRIMFGYCDTEKDLDRYQGVEYDVIFIDEATQFTEYMFKVISACCRGVNDFPKRIYLTCNPGGRGHGWVKRLFIDRKYIGDEKPEDYAFIAAKVTDNKALMKAQPEYIDKLKALPEKLRKAWLEGSWDIFEGQVFEEFRNDPEHYADRRYTHVINPFEIPDGWNILRSYDFGYAKPFSCAWWAVDYDGVIYRILEYYGCRRNEPNTGVKMTASEQFKNIREFENTHPWLKNKDIQGVADPAIWNSESGESIAETAAKYGIYFDKGDNERIAGLMQMHYRLAFDENGYPMMYIFKNCDAFIRTIPELCYSPKKPEDVDSDQEDHVYDESRYLCMSRPITPRLPAEKINTNIDDPLDIIKDLKKGRR